MSKVPQAFVPDVMQVPLDKILPSRRLPMLLGSVKFRQIVSSIQSVGVIEPLSVSLADAAEGQYLLLDGHVRFLALHELGAGSAPCLLASDDEAYTYNTRINRLSTIQETRMLQEAVAKGVSRERLAQTLNIDISSLLKKLKLLDGICPEAVAMLKDRQFSPEISRLLLLNRTRSTRRTLPSSLATSNLSGVVTTSYQSCPSSESSTFFALLCARERRCLSLGPVAGLSIGAKWTSPWVSRNFSILRAYGFGTAAMLRLSMTLEKPSFH